jgi:hypothetical protein
MLNFEDYRKDEAKQFLIDRFDWRDYGGKHYESRFTKFFQSYYLPTKFGYDKRRAHLASLVVSGEMLRTQALEELKCPPFDPSDAEQDKIFVAKKLGVSEKDFEAILAEPCKTYLDYPSNANRIETLLRIKSKIIGLLRSKN